MKKEVDPESFVERNFNCLLATLLTAAKRRPQVSLVSGAQKVAWQDVGAFVERTFLILKRDVFLEFQVRYLSEKHTFFFPAKVHIVNS